MGLLNAPTFKKTFKSQTWRSAAILKTVKLPYLNFDEIWHSDVYWPLTTHTTVKITNL